MAGLQVSLTSFVSGTVISSSAVDANFANLNSANVFSSGGVVIQNNDGYQAYDTGGVAHTLLQIETADNDAHLRTTPANGKLKITQNAGQFDVAVFIDNGSGAVFGVKNATPADAFEVRQNGNVIALGAYQTHGTTATIATSQTFDTFDVAEVFPHDRFYESGTIVCPSGSRLSCCTHDGCRAAMIVSLAPGLNLGGTQVDYQTGILPIALAGRVVVICSDPHIAQRDLVTSDGMSGVRAMRPGETGFALGFALNEAKDGRVGIYIRPIFCTNGNPLREEVAGQTA